MADAAHLSAMFTNQLWWALPLLLLLALLRTPAFRGLVGTWALQLAVKSGLDQNDYHMFRHVKLPLANGTARIDHLIVSQYGVFMCKTNSMRGLISGGRDQVTWTCQLGKHERPFHNPLQQHQQHARLLEAMLGLDAGKVLPALVFVGDVSFRSEMPENVMKMSGYIRYIKSKTIPIFTKADMVRLSEKIASGHLDPAGQAAGQPAKRSGKAKAEKAAQTCPRCGSIMILRAASKGAQAGKKYWVCSAYPKCKSAVPAGGRRSKRSPEFGPPKLT